MNDSGYFLKKIADTDAKYAHFEKPPSFRSSDTVNLYTSISSENSFSSYDFSEEDREEEQKEELKLKEKLKSYET